MRAVRIIERLLFESLSDLHTKTIKSLLWGIESVIVGDYLSLTAIGRSSMQGNQVKHNIKRADRLLANSGIHENCKRYFAVLAATLVGKNKQPIILVDWTDAPKEHEAIVAAVPNGGRALSIYSEVYPIGTKGKTKIESSFLKTLKTILPADCCPVIVTDAGFRNPWFKTVIKLGWHYVGRLRGKFCLKRQHDDWLYSDEFLSQASARPVDLGNWITSKSTPLHTRLVLVSKYKKTKTKKRRKSKKGSNPQRKARARAKEPWLLCTSLSKQKAKQIVKIYATRMQIEEFFRDIKNHRFGWSFAYSRSGDSSRINTLILLACFASLAVTLVGQAAENRGIHYAYQANTIKNRRVLSLFYLGIQVISRAEYDQFSMHLLFGVMHQISVSITAV